jgi:hypothetical protein
MEPPQAASGGQAAAHPYDGTAAQIVPTNVEKLPLFHWRPGARLLQIGSRDGASFDDDLDRAEARTFRRTLDPSVIEEAVAKTKVVGCCAAWSAPLHYPVGMELLSARQGALVVTTPGYGQAAVLERLLERVDAWLLLIGEHLGPLAQTILERANHVEILLGLAGDRFPHCAFERAKAIHLTTQRTGAVAEQDRQQWFATARARLPENIPIYDQQATHSDCRSCGSRLVWRSGGRSRLENLDPASASCRSCGAAAGFTF